MPSAILSKYGTATAFTKTLASLANATGRQTTIVDNTTARFSRLIIHAKITLGTSPTANRGIYFYLIRDDGEATPLRSDGAGASDAALTPLNSQLLGALSTGTAPATGTVLTGDFIVDEPGKKFGAIIFNDSGVALNATEANHVVEYIGVNPENQ